MRNSLSVLAAVWALLLASTALAAETPPPPVPAAAPAAPKEAGVPVTSPENRLELRLPAPYWEALTPQEVAGQMQGGCSQGRVPASLIYLLRDKDALVEIVLSRSDRSFLMRTKDDMEAFENGVMKAIQDQVGAGASEVDSGFTQRDGMTVHHYGLTIMPTAHGGGCAAMTQSSSPPQKMHFLFVDYFVRPRGRGRGLLPRQRPRAGRDVQGAAVGDRLHPGQHPLHGQAGGRLLRPRTRRTTRCPPRRRPPRAWESTAPRAAGCWPRGLMIAIWLMLRWRKKPKV